MIDEVVKKVLGGMPVRAAVQQALGSGTAMTLGDFARMGGASVASTAGAAPLGPGRASSPAGFGKVAKWGAIVEAGAQTVGLGAASAGTDSETEKVFYMAVLVAALDKARGQSAFSLDAALTDVTSQLDGLRQGRGDISGMAKSAAASAAVQSTLRAVAASLNSAAEAAVRAVK